MGRYFHILATDEGPMYNENGYGYLGVVGIFGFLALLLMLLRNWDWKAGRTESRELGDRLWLLSRLNVMALLASIAGFGSIIGIFCAVHPRVQPHQPLHCVFALLAVGLALEKTADPAHRAQPQGAGGCGHPAAWLRLLGAAGLFRPEYEEIQDKWYQDEAYGTRSRRGRGGGYALPAAVHEKL